MSWVYGDDGKVKVKGSLSIISCARTRPFQYRLSLSNINSYNSGRLYHGKALTIVYWSYLESGRRGCIAAAIHR